MGELLTGVARSRFWTSRAERYEAQLARLVLDGVLDARQLSDHHWRVWKVGAEQHSVDYWPRTGTVAKGTTVFRDKPSRGWQRLLHTLGWVRADADQGGAK